MGGKYWQEWITQAETARLLHVLPKIIYDRMNSGEIPSELVESRSGGSVRRILRETIKNMMVGNLRTKKRGRSKNHLLYQLLIRRGGDGG